MKRILTTLQRCGGRVSASRHCSTALLMRSSCAQVAGGAQASRPNWTIQTSGFFPHAAYTSHAKLDDGAPIGAGASTCVVTDGQVHLRMRITLRALACLLCPASAPRSPGPALKTTHRSVAHTILKHRSAMTARPHRTTLQVSECLDASDAWLARMPRGAYTNARTVNRNSVFELDFHIERLASSANLMLRQAMPGDDGACSDERADAAALQASDIREALLPQVGQYITPPAPSPHPNAASSASSRTAVRV